MTTNRRLTTSAAFVALAALASFGIFLGTQHAQAQTQPEPDRISFGLVGITPGQTARVNAVNATPPDGTWPPGPTRVTLTFLDSQGRYFRGRDGNPLGLSAMLDRGQSVYFELNGNEFVARGETRLQLRALVMAWPPGPSAPNPIVPTFEVVDNSTGKTVLLYPGVIRGFNPQPDPPAEGQ